jgi:hypothetical protein
MHIINLPYVFPYIILSVQTLSRFFLFPGHCIISVRVAGVLGSPQFFNITTTTHAQYLNSSPAYPLSMAGVLGYLHIL